MHGKATIFSTRSMVKLLFATLLAIGIILGIIYFQCHPGLMQRKTSDQPLRIARYYWPGMYWVEIAQKKGWFKEAALQVEIVDTNPDYYASLHDVAAGKIDTQDFYLYDFVRFNLQGVNLVMVVNTDISSGSEAIVARKEIENIRDLKGKTLAVPRGTNLEYMLATALERSGLTLDDVLVKDIMTEKAAEEFAEGRLDAIMAWEPYATRAMTAGNGHKLFDSSEIYGLSRSGFTFTRKFVETRPNDVQTFVDVWHKTTLFIREKPEESFRIISENNRVTIEDVKRFAQIDSILSFEDNRIAFTPSRGFESLYGTARKISRHLIEQGMVAKEVDTANLFDARFLHAIEPRGPFCFLSGIQLHNLRFWEDR